MRRIVCVASKQQLKDFIDFPHVLYKHDPNYVPGLFITQRNLLTPGKHPFHEHSSIKLFLAYNGATIIGRIAAILNNNHNSFNNTNDGFFGFFDCIDDQETAFLLIQKAATWLREQGVNALIGPVNVSTNEICGLLIDGYDKPPVVMMPYNAPYYLALLEQVGLRKKVDLFAYHFIDHNVYNDKFTKLFNALEQRLKQRNSILIREINLKNFSEEVSNIGALYRAAWNKNMGFVPMTDKEFQYMARDLKMILDPQFCLVAEHNKQLVGFALAIPDLNQIQIKIKNGRLFPLGLFKLLFLKKKITRIRVLCLGVLESYRRRGIEACLYGHIIRNGLNARIKTAEASWTLEHNGLINNAIENVNGVLYKRYRIFEKAI